MSNRRSPPSASGSRSTSPYPNPNPRPSAHGKSKKREQFSACGACRMRRVRCDLKDLQITHTGQHPPCSNCKERGLNCIDEFAEVKQVKLLRRGRRLQQVEAVYGRMNPEEASVHHTPPPQAVIPKLRKEFFDSSFFRKFHVQKPILEPLEFRERYASYLSGNTECLPIPGQLIAMVLVVWAATFGVDEYGREVQDEEHRDNRQRTEQITDMLQEMLYLVDLHGILRKPTWDGVRLLLLLLPLTQDIQLPIERLVMHEATLSQIHALCAVVPPTASSIHQEEYIDALIRARVYWYGHVLDGVTNGLRGGRLLLDDEDLSAFERTLPTRNDGTKMFAMYVSTRRMLAIPLQISSVCRQVHDSLTGTKARRMDTVDEAAIHNAWNTLDRCWRELDELRHWAIGDLLESEDIHRFIHSWQIYIFECYNVIRENLKQRIAPHSPQNNEPSLDRGSIELLRLYEDAKIRCDGAVRSVVLVIQQNLGTDFFRYDACLVRDGCFFAAFLLANDNGSKEDIETCLQALGQMRWIFSKSDERMQTLRLVWEARVQRIPRNDSPNSIVNLATNGYSEVRRHPPRTLSVPPLALVPSSSAAGLSQSAPNTAYSEDGRWPVQDANASRTLAPHGSLPSHLTSPLISSHSPRYRQVSQPLSGLGTPTMSSSIGTSSSSLLAGPSTSSLSFARPDAAQSFYMPVSSYDYYDDSSTGDHTQSSSDSTPTPPAVRYQPSQYFSESVPYSHPPVAEGSPNDTLPSQSSGTDEVGGSYY